MERQLFMKRFFKAPKQELFGEFDSYVHQDLTKAFERGVSLLAIEEAASYQPLVFSFPESKSKDFDYEMVYHEDKMRYSLTRFTSLQFDENFLYYYTCIIDHKNARMYNDMTVEVSYLDIKGLQTSFKFKQINDVYHHILELKILLHNKDITIPIRDRIINVDTDPSLYMLDEDVVDVLSQLKRFLREKMIL